MSEHVRGPWRQTATGRQFFLLDPRPEDVHIEDIATHLANQCRFTGAVRSFYSVAQHSWHVSELVPRRIALWGLLHDAAEAYTGDVLGPLKRLIRNETPLLQKIEAGIDAAIRKRFDMHALSHGDEKLIKVADLAALATERRDVTVTPREVNEDEDVEPDPEELTPFGPAGARRLFLDRFEQLRRATP